MPNSSAVAEIFTDLERQRDLISSCTSLWKDLTNHFSSLDQIINLKSETLRSNLRSLDLRTQRKLSSLRRREESIETSIDLAISRVDHLSANPRSNRNHPDLAETLRASSANMDSVRFSDLIASNRKESDLLRQAIPLALKESIDPAIFVMDVIDRVFAKSPGDSGWVCVMMLEGLVSALEDPVMGSERLLVTRIARERARGIAGIWREEIAKESAKAQDVHAFLQHLVTFGIGEKEEREFYRKLVVSVSWRKQMPRLAVALGLEDRMGGTFLYLAIYCV